MNAAVLDAAIGAATSAGLASLFLPSLEQAWAADPTTDGGTRRKLNTGELVVLLVVGSLGTLHSLKARSILPLAIALAMAGAVVCTYEKAFRAPPTD